MSITEAIFSLPGFVKVPEGHTFQLQISHNGPNITLAYTFLKIQPEWYWQNPYLFAGKKYNCNFLYLNDGIETDADFLRAIEEAKAFFNQHGLMR